MKCPYTGRHGMISPETVPYLQLDERTGLLTLNPSHNYMFQVQGLLHITNRSVCDFVVYTFSDHRHLGTYGLLGCDKAGQRISLAFVLLIFTSVTMY